MTFILERRKPFYLRELPFDLHVMTASLHLARIKLIFLHFRSSFSVLFTYLHIKTEIPLNHKNVWVHQICEPCKYWIITKQLFRKNYLGKTTLFRVKKPCSFLRPCSFPFLIFFRLFNLFHFLFLFLLSFYLYFLFFLDLYPTLLQVNAFRIFFLPTINRIFVYSMSSEFANYVFLSTLGGRS